MATNAISVARYSGRTNYELRLYVWRDTVSGNSSRFSWWLRAYNLNHSNLTWATGPFTWNVWIAYQEFTGAAGLNFSGGQEYIQLGSGQTDWYGHSPEGHLSFAFEALHNASSSVFGVADTPLTTFDVNRIPKAPSGITTPTFNSASATAGSLNWTIYYPGDNGGATVLDYYVELATDAGFTNIVAVRTSAAGSASSQTFAGLGPATSYWLRYRARNEVGSSSFSSGSQGTTLAGVPSPPYDFSVTGSSPNSADLAWTAPASNGAAITSYRIQRATNSAFTSGLVEFSDPASPYTVTGLEPSTTYYFRVAAVNSAGSSPWSGVISTLTVSGAYYSNGTSWQAVGVFVSDGTTWEPATLHGSVGGVWVDAI